MQSDTKLYYDGELVNKGILKTYGTVYELFMLQMHISYFLDRILIEKEKFHPLYNGGSFVIGQEQDGIPYGGLFDKNQGFSGKMTQVELWNTELKSEEIHSIANCIKPTVRSQNRVITWDSKAWLPVKTKLRDVPLNILCEKNIFSNQLIWPEAVSMELFGSFCEITKVTLIKYV